MRRPARGREVPKNPFTAWDLCEDLAFVWLSTFSSITDLVHGAWYAGCENGLEMEAITFTFTIIYQQIRIESTT